MTLLDYLPAGARSRILEAVSRSERDDDEAKCRLVLRLMEKHCEPGGWHYLIPGSAEKFARITQQETPSDD